MAHFSDKGAHCEAPYCRQLDFLPFKCDFCSKTFCLDHFQPDSHECASDEWKKQDKRVIVCPECDLTIRLTAAEDPNLVWERHHNSGECADHQRIKPQKSQKCPVKFCRELLTLSNKYSCKQCDTVVCLKHRLPGDHDCELRKREGKSSHTLKLGGAKNITDYLKMVKWKKAAQSRQT
eukprot:Protomagalhaensia_wolfi_Nauph_80__478@NODE_1268_length_1622_cov_231_109918_g977_i0_p2_GENE_NODE_1268_length_1622_cov_231_109918_g977_i0NODE_1268_length_1622_cov_231_109918_g977_i0_p2_ORF_typecomplete_len178_score11_58zfAN1/PF01428_16/5_3e15zfAN1/PF01428_16/1_2e02zfAN1/PF01428_16/7_1e07Transp_Tc5_C/PF04236_15/0_0045Transp_Tc5_C/PF04236_15/6_2e03Transp_Tc5_C/PF04236_15/3_1zfC5HC2/PF02928_16/1_1zfC5HC2/PF02928_16/2_3e03zfC5HC2/PF02928_16/3_8DUF2180/PF09947_9/0_16DUF2180/PF09947_9/4e02DUF2180/PF0994